MALHCDADIVRTIVGARQVKFLSGLACSQSQDVRWFGYEQGRSQSNFVAAKPPGTEDQVQRDGNPGNVGLGFKIAAGRLGVLALPSAASQVANVTIPCGKN
jgi:hypothetical protein